MVKNYLKWKMQPSPAPAKPDSGQRRTASSISTIFKFKTSEILSKGANEYDSNPDSHNCRGDCNSRLWPTTNACRVRSSDEDARQTRRLQRQCCENQYSEE